MSRRITPPINRVPIGTVTINGQTLEVAQHPEFVRFFFDLYTRVGGGVAPSNDEISALIDGAQLGIFRGRQAQQEPADIAYVKTFHTNVAHPQELPSIPYISAFLQRKQEQAAQLTDASALICSRVFAAR